jgi:hypothetical protein
VSESLSTISGLDFFLDDVLPLGAGFVGVLNMLSSPLPLLVCADFDFFFGFDRLSPSEHGKLLMWSLTNDCTSSLVVASLLLSSSLSSDTQLCDDEVPSPSESTICGNDDDDFALNLAVWRCLKSFELATSFA